MPHSKYDMVYTIDLVETSDGKDLTEGDFRLKLRRKKHLPHSEMSAADKRDYKAKRKARAQAENRKDGQLEYDIWKKNDDDELVTGLFQFKCPPKWSFQETAFNFDQAPRGLYTELSSNGRKASFEGLGDERVYRADIYDILVIHPNGTPMLVDPIVQNGSSLPFIGNPLD